MLSSLLSAAGLAALRDEVAAVARRGRRRAILLAAAILLWLLAFGFTLASLTIWLAANMGAIAAFGSLAAAFAVIALVVQLIAAARRKPRSPLSAPTPGAAKKDAQNGNPLGAMAIFALAGYLIGRHLFRR